MGKCTIRYGPPAHICVSFHSNAVCLHAIPERLKGVFKTRRYTNTCLPLPYLPTASISVSCVCVRSNVVCLRAIPERLRGVFKTRRYTNTCLPLPYLTFQQHRNNRRWGNTLSHNWRCGNGLPLLLLHFNNSPFLFATFSWLSYSIY